VNEILDWQEDICGSYAPPALEFFTEEELSHSELPDELQSPPLGPIARALAWLGSWKH
jgi:hypothetical protein